MGCSSCVQIFTIETARTGNRGRRLKVLTMATTKLWTDDLVSADPRVNRFSMTFVRTRNSDFVNNSGAPLANQPALLERTWSSVKEVMIAPGKLDPLTKELIYIAVSTANACSYCVQSHTASSEWPPKPTHWRPHSRFPLIQNLKWDRTVIADAYGWGDCRTGNQNCWIRLRHVTDSALTYGDTYVRFLQTIAVN
jgi:hypothetical protein